MTSLAALALAGAWGAEEGTAAAAAATDERWFRHGLVELKRQATARGTPDETTKTNLKFDVIPPSGAIALLRLELPFPDSKTSFAGSAFDPDFGDAKVRVGFRAAELAATPVTSFVELTLPTADPPSQGSGKFQLSAGAKPQFALPDGPAAIGAPRQQASVQVQQVVSFAGDPDRADINQTKFELEWRDNWPGGHHAKATVKPVIDWVGGGRSGGVLELEGGWPLDRRWALALMAGGRLWGEGVPGTYATRVELKLSRRW
ncbi:MAG: hypothetical protein JNL87_02165 [Burkholderiaceae bacterium]|nr:hypothetical protein [Burkholderiaceae bacterium]